MYIRIFIWPLGFVNFNNIQFQKRLVYKIIVIYEFFKPFFIKLGINVQVKDTYLPILKKINLQFQNGVHFKLKWQKNGLKTKNINTNNCLESIPKNENLTKITDIY